MAALCLCRCLPLCLSTSLSLSLCLSLRLSLRLSATLRLPLSLPLTRSTSSATIQIKLLGLPGLPIFGIQLRIGRRFESFLSDDPGNLMVAMAVGGSAGESRHDDFRPKLPNHTHKVAENLIVAPLLQSFFGRFRKSEFILRRKELLGSVEPSCRKQFFRTDDPKIFKQFRPQKVLAAISTRNRKIGGARTLPSRQPGKQCAVFVVRVGAGMKHAGNNIQSIQSLRESHGTAIFRGLRCSGSESQNYQEEQDGFGFHGVRNCTCNWKELKTVG